jgi:hypothetical protein
MGFGFCAFFEQGLENKKMNWKGWVSNSIGWPIFLFIIGSLSVGIMIANFFEFIKNRIKK